MKELLPRLVPLAMTLVFLFLGGIAVINPKVIDDRIGKENHKAFDQFEKALKRDLSRSRSYWVRNGGNLWGYRILGVVFIAISALAFWAIVNSLRMGK